MAQSTTVVSTTPKPLSLSRLFCTVSVLLLSSTVQARHMPRGATHAEATTPSVPREWRGLNEPEASLLSRRREEAVSSTRKHIYKSDLGTAPPTAPLTAPPTIPLTAPPTTSPTAEPPSMTPSKSFVATARSEDGVVTSKCIEGPPDGGDVTRYDLVFAYVICFDRVFSSIDEAQAKVKPLERTLHTALAAESLVCTYSSTQPLEIVGLSSGAMDVVTSGADEQGAGECWNVDAAISADVYHPQARRHRALSEYEVQAYFIQVMKAILPGLQGDGIVSLTLNGFSNADSELTTTLELAGGGGTGSSPGVVAAAEYSNIPVEDAGPEGGVFGVLILVVAACVVVALVVVVNKRRKRLHKAYLQHLEEVNKLDFDTEIKEEMKVRERVVDYDEDAMDSEDDDDNLGTFEIDPKESFEYKQQLPVFIPAGGPPRSLAKLKAELGASPRSKRRSKKNHNKPVKNAHVV
jgi:hypothetical protein